MIIFAADASSGEIESTHPGQCRVLPDVGLLVPLRVVGRLPPVSRGSLAPWQARRVRLYIESNIVQRMAIEDLARLVSLSTSHFSRAFKVSFGITVHRYIMQKRVEAAQRLMLDTSQELSSIAAGCGLSDQSHLTRWFRRVVGETPASWRRARWTP